MERNRLTASGLPQALQKAVFYMLKGGLLRCNSRPFALQFTAFRVAIHGLLQGERPSSANLLDRNLHQLPSPKGANYA